MKIRVKNKNKKIPEDLLKKCDNNEILARIFYNRGIKNSNELEKYLDYKKYTPYDAYEFPKMIEACKLIRKAIDNNEKIAIYGDYDADGITSTTVLMLGLRELGANLVYHVPDRFLEGYGMNEDIVKKMYEENVTTIITCDCGISNFEEIKLAKSLGMTVILTDHHTIGESIPEADVVINFKLLPLYHPARDISGCATAYFLIKSLYFYLNKELKDDCLDLVALSIISDVMPLKEENRYLFNMGFEKLKAKERLGIKALCECSGIDEISVEDIGFQITPRLNAVGRMDNAKTAVELFLSEDEEKAAYLANIINRFNVDRKNIQNEIYINARELVETEKKNKKILVLYGENWHHGIIGIVAGKICEEYSKPCIILSQNENGLIVGSARSTEQLNIYETLSKFSNYLVKFGGHSQAAGLSLESNNLDKFTKEIEDYANIYIPDDYEKIVEVDAILPFSQINEELLNLIAKGEPYGEAFLPPQFVTEDVKIKKETISRGTHHFMTLVDKTKREVGTTLWNYGPESLEGKECTIIYDIYKDTYNGRNEIKIKISDILFDFVEIEEYKVKWEDRRDKDYIEVIKEFPDAKIFYEGPKVFKPNLPVIDSSYNEKVSTIILYSVPRNNEVLINLIENVSPDKVILNYTYKPRYDFNNFQIMFMGVIKNIIKNNFGEISTKEFSDIMQVDKEFIIVFSKFLESLGYVKVEAINEKLKYEILDSEKKNGDNHLANIATRYLNEKVEYIKYMSDVPIYDKVQEE